ncbi:MAG: hypothetical protein AAB432_02335 [Patescibacteria group bacterium]
MEKIPQETESMRKKVERAKEAPFEDVTLEELRQDWLKASGIAGRHNAPIDAKEKARIAKEKYLEVLEKEQNK